MLLAGLPAAPQSHAFLSPRRAVLPSELQYLHGPTWAGDMMSITTQRLGLVFFWRQTVETTAESFFSFRH